jgi:NAD(P)-dependent dehydrogenase (short-subunit alcohol dehydrogenase family)
LQIADVASSAGRRRIAERSRAGGRRLELLIHNASDLGASPLPPLIEYPIDRWRRVMETNLWGPVDLTRRLRRELAAAGGLVVNISSDAALGGYPGWGGYGSSKAALDLASLTLAHELRADRIAVVSVDPGDMRTVMHQAAYPGQDISDRPLPEVTLPFWIWLLGQDRMKLSGRRFRAQATNWEVSP